MKLVNVNVERNYKNCKSRKKTVDKLVAECSEKIDGNKMIYNDTLNAVPLIDYKKYAILIQYTLYYLSYFSY